MLSLLILIVVVGFALWLISLIPMDPTFKKIAIGVVIFIVVIYVLTTILPGVLGPHALHGLH